MTCIYPGSFDPMTFGHLDIINRAAKFCDTLIVAVLNNSSKTKATLFSVVERMEILREATMHLPNVEIDSFAGLLVNYAQARGASVVIRGLRAVTDFEYEFQMALTNRTLGEGQGVRLETLFIPTSTEFLYLSSGIVKEIAAHKGDISNMVPPHAAKKIYKKFDGTYQGGI
ncbi:MAG: pantetheine-phosphate adenylyltransferase [Defluviitaleaceae bacterium]|nr:pantetheine-phosphate adenylyltransferase [Defluviitaleaceae bacterium]